MACETWILKIMGFKDFVLFILNFFDSLLLPGIEEKDEDDDDGGEEQEETNILSKIFKIILWCFNKRIFFLAMLQNVGVLWKRNVFALLWFAKRQNIHGS